MLFRSEYWNLIKKMSEAYGFPEITNFVVQKAINIGEKEEIEENKDAWPFFDKGKKEEKTGSIVNPKKVQYDVHKNRFNNISDFPLSTIEKMWLKSICSDPRIRLFVEPSG